MSAFIGEEMVGALKRGEGSPACKLGPYSPRHRNHGTSPPGAEGSHSCIIQRHADSPREPRSIPEAIEQLSWSSAECQTIPPFHRDPLKREWSAGWKTVNTSCNSPTGHLQLASFRRSHFPSTTAAIILLLTVHPRTLNGPLDRGPRIGGCSGARREFCSRKEQMALRAERGRKSGDRVLSKAPKGSLWLVNFVLSGRRQYFPVVVQRPQKAHPDTWNCEHCASWSQHQPLPSLGKRKGRPRAD